MASNRCFNLIHISDLHFSSGSDRSNQNHAHSIDHLVGLQNKITASDEMDMLVVSGDISNKGDRQSLIMASGWLFGSIPIGAGEHTGLKLDPKKVGVIPGNHDAWNSGKDNGMLLDRRQRSVENYNYSFPDHAVPISGCSYDWIEKDGNGLYIAFVDSCFLGDTADDTESTFGTLRYDAMAKGKLTVKQTEQLLEWHDRGMHGLLIKNNTNDAIKKEKFSQSLKILVMHHYLFEPPEKKSDYFMRIQHRDIVFQNIALSDFDILLCGHKHIASFDVHDYGKHFDRRAVQRHMVNYFRRLIGLESLPIQFTDEKGRRFSKSLTQIAEIIGSCLKSMITSKQNKNTMDDNALADKVYEMLKEGLDSPDSLRRNIDRFLHDAGEAGASTLESDELKRIQKRISTGLSISDRKRLREVADEVSKMSEQLKSRAFLQIMSGSSAKMPSSNEQKRSFQTYKIDHEADDWKIECQRFEWDGSAFQPNSQKREHTFRRKF